MRRYGAKEYAFGAPIAEGLAVNPAFQTWVLSQTKFGPLAASSRLLHEEMSAKRNAASWWASHYTESCRCDGCSGQETDLLAVFESEERRFALHFEIKQPTDRFAPGGRQARSYSLRANCWITNPPRAIVKHDDATTVLLCSEKSLETFKDDAAHFDVVITFEAVARSFPELALPF